MNEEREKVSVGIFWKYNINEEREKLSVGIFWNFLKHNYFGNNIWKIKK